MRLARGREGRDTNANVFSYPLLVTVCGGLVQLVRTPAVKPNNRKPEDPVPEREI
jgi:hypothetical protein